MLPFGSGLLFTRNSLNVQLKVNFPATSFGPCLNHEKLFAFAGESPLHVAVESGSIEIVKLLLDHGANVEKADKCGKTFRELLFSDFASVWVRAIVYPEQPQCTTKCQSFCNIYFAPSLNHVMLFAFVGESPLNVAAKSGSIEIVKLLLGL